MGNILEGFNPKSREIDLDSSLKLIEKLRIVSVFLRDEFQSALIKNLKLTKQR